MRKRHFGAQIAPFDPTKTFLGKAINIILPYLLDSFIAQNKKTILKVDLKLWWYVIFGPNMTYFPWTSFFFLKNQ